MNGWLNEYKAAAYRTRWLGLIGAVAILAAAARELSRIYIGVSWAEAPFQGEFADTVMFEVAMLVLLGLSFVVRTFFLLFFTPERYSFIALSWLLSFAAVVFYLWEMSPWYNPTTTCGEDGRCFTIYHHSREDWAALACFGFLLFSFLRALVTAAMAGSKFRYK